MPKQKVLETSVESKSLCWRNNQQHHTLQIKRRIQEGKIVQKKSGLSKVKKKIELLTKIVPIENEQEEQTNITKRNR